MFTKKMDVQVLFASLKEKWQNGFDTVKAYFASLLFSEKVAWGALGVGVVLVIIGIALL